MKSNRLDIANIRNKIKKLKGPQFWRSLDELAGTKEFEEYVRSEYPEGVIDDNDGFTRREFLKLMGASLLMMSFTGCSRQPLEKIVPYVRRPEEIVPGKPLFFATAMPFNGHATGVLVESHMGRPTKIEGNPEHPDSLGATSAIHQASILNLYDPDRAQVIRKSGELSTWNGFKNDMAGELKHFTATGGRGLRFLTGRVISPTLYQQIHEILTKYPEAKWHQYDPVNRDRARMAQEYAFEQFVDETYDFQKADIVLSIGSDFLIERAGSLRYAKKFVERRDLTGGNKTMNRLYVIEAGATLTGSYADHRLAVKPGRMDNLARALAAKLNVGLSDLNEPHLTKDEHKWVNAAAEDLRSHRGRSLVIAGDQAPAGIQALAYAINQNLGNAGKTVKYIRPIEERAVINGQSIADLTKDMHSGTVQMLVTVGGNPAYNAPADMDFVGGLQKVRKRVRLSLYEDETSVHCHWQIPMTHYLEMFSDARASDGTATMIQPLIEPLYNGKSSHELFNVFLGKTGLAGDEVVKSFWQDKLGGINFEKSWRKFLHDGLIAGTAFKAKTLTAKTTFSKADWAKLGGTNSRANDSIEIIFRPDPSLWDGEFANNGWLQELPKPFTKLTWDNAVSIGTQTAERLNLSNEDLIDVAVDGKSLRLPVWIVPGHAEDTLTVFLGFGRKFPGKVGNQVGFDTYTLYTSAALAGTGEVSVKKTGKRYKLASTQLHNSMEGRALVRHADLETFKHQPDFATSAHHALEPASFYKPHPESENAWGMSVNLGNCIGCNACIVACQSENNAPVVGKDQVRRGREMQWLRVDTYFEGDVDAPKTHHQPVMCMHCENAPCEPVCPAGATVHSKEGLNDMVYNRCIGTRYCSNNCPYKVRRFNFYQYAEKKEPYSSMQNPDVTVRNRGVMEKCTFCVQRINHARIEAIREKRPIADGEITTACESACPTKAIVFGNINDAESRVTKMKQLPLSYGILTELNTSPRLTYLAKVKNPNPALDTGHHAQAKAGH